MNERQASGPEHASQPSSDTHRSREHGAEHGAADSRVERELHGGGAGERGAYSVVRRGPHLQRQQRLLHLDRVVELDQAVGPRE
eukprot:7381723-Prymnesium_polylepis.1